MSKDLGYFLIIIGVFALLFQTGFFSADALKTLVKAPYVMPLAFIITGLVSVISGMFPVLKPLNTVVGVLFAILILAWLFAGDFSVMMPGKEFEQYALIGGLKIEFSLGEVVIEHFNETHFRISGTTINTPGITVTPDDVLSVEGVVGKIVYDSDDENYSSKYSIAIGTYSDSSGRSCRIACAGETTRGIGGRNLNFEIVIGEIRII